MQRALFSVFALATLSSGCIIYETEHLRDDGDCIDCDTGFQGDTGLQNNVGDDDDDPNVDPEPELVLDLTVTEGYAGEVLLTWIEANQDFDFTAITAITFVGAVSVQDTVIRADEAMLLLEVDHDATPGTVQVFIEMGDDAMLLETPFTITDAPADGGDGTGDPCP